jgi:hypothetical protein
MRFAHAGRITFAERIQQCKPLFRFLVTCWNDCFSAWVPRRHTYRRWRPWLNALYIGVVIALLVWLIGSGKIRETVSPTLKAKPTYRTLQRQIAPPTLYKYSADLNLNVAGILVLLLH